MFKAKSLWANMPTKLMSDSFQQPDWQILFLISQEVTPLGVHQNTQSLITKEVVEFARQAVITARQIENLENTSLITKSTPNDLTGLIVNVHNTKPLTLSESVFCWCLDTHQSHTAGVFVKKTGHGRFLHLKRIDALLKTKTPPLHWKPLPP